MTSQNPSIYTPAASGHTVRDVVEHTPALVNEAWCRSLLRHTLDSLEQQYASSAPHRPITPDTLVMLANGEPLLLPSLEDAPDAAPGLAADLHALALVVHYAITAELPPEGPLGPRLYDNYSDQLTRGLDSCLGPNRRLRPNTVEDMRALLGIEAGSAGMPAAAPAAEATPVEFVEPVATAPLDPIILPPAAAVAQPEAVDPVAPEPVGLRAKTEAGMLRKAASQDSAAAGATRAPRPAERIAPNPSVLHDTGKPAPAAPRRPSAGIAPAAPGRPRVDTTGMESTGRRNSRNSQVQRWGMIAGAAIVALAAGGALFSWMQQDDTAQMVVPQAVPPADRAATGLDSGETVVAPPGATSAPAPAADAQAANGAPAATGTEPAAAAPAGAAPQPGGQAAAGTDDAIINGTTYKLLIKPWATVYIDGVDRGVSPPVKRLTLAPGQHTIRLVNPNFPDHVITVDAGLRESAAIQYDFRAAAR